MDDPSKRERGDDAQPPFDSEAIPVGGASGESFSNAADAVADLAGNATLIDSASTTNLYWRLHGYTETHYFCDSNGIQYTVFYNPVLKPVFRRPPFRPKSELIHATCH
jgi:hypothetical protein